MAAHRRMDRDMWRLCLLILMICSHFFILSVMVNYPSNMNSQEFQREHSYDGLPTLVGGEFNPRVKLQYQHVEKLLYSEPPTEEMCYIAQNPSPDYTFPRGLIEVGHPNLKMRTYPTVPRPDTCDGCFPYIYHTILNPTVCAEESSLLQALVLAVSLPEQFELRRAIRKTWGRNNEHKRVIFLVGIGYSEKEEQQLLKEHNEYHDILQDSYIDSNFNLSLKLLSGFHWWRKHCRCAPFVIRTSAESYVNVEQLLDGLSHDQSMDYKCVGECFGRNVPRMLRDQVYLSENDYPHQFFPQYCFGTTYVLTAQTIIGILTESQDIPYVVLGDAYIGLVLEFLNIKVDLPYCEHRSGYSMYDPGALKMLPDNFVEVHVVQTAEAMYRLHYTFKNLKKLE